MQDLKGVELQGEMAALQRPSCDLAFLEWQSEDGDNIGIISEIQGTCTGHTAARSYSSHLESGGRC